MLITAQLGEFPVPALKQRGGLPVSRVVVVNERRELCQVFTQVDISPTRALGGCAIP